MHILHFTIIHSNIITCLLHISSLTCNISYIAFSCFINTHLESHNHTSYIQQLISYPHSCFHTHLFIALSYYHLYIQIVHEAHQGFHSPIYHVGTFDLPRSSRELEATPLDSPNTYDIYNLITTQLHALKSLSYMHMPSL